MSWLSELKKTYDNNVHEVGREKRDDKDNLLYVLSPICHTTQNAHIEIALDGKGHFRRASVIEQKGQRQTILPATEKAAGRSGSLVAPLSLGDKLQYIAKDYHRYGAKKPGFEKYISRLQRWAESVYGTPEIRAVYQYLASGTILADLIQVGVLYFDHATQSFPAEWQGEDQKPPILSAVAKGDQLDALVRFSVEISGELNPHLWSNPKIWESWIQYYLEHKIVEDNFDIDKKKAQYPEGKEVFCYVEGSMQQFAATHPAKIRNAGDGAKLISSNDSSGFTYRGRFLDDEQACGIGYETSQKAHNALRWLIAKQGYWLGDFAVVAWAPSGIKIPSLVKDTYDTYATCADDGLFAESSNDSDTKVPFTDTGEIDAKNLVQRLRGYGKTIDPKEGVVVMGLNSLTPGRLSISFYRELQASVLLENVVDWHETYAWEQNYGSKKKFIGAPAPRDIALAAYRVKPDDAIVQHTMARILPCIVDGGAPIPWDIVKSVVRAATKRISYEPWEWRKILGIACGLYKGYENKTRNKEEYGMALDKTSNSRDYLFGRLLAVADVLEYTALDTSEKNRPTKAAQLMQRFAHKPAETWKTIELGLAPYKKRLQSRKKLTRFNEVTQEIMDLFEPNDFHDKKKLSGEFLLGFHCQKSELFKKNNTDNNNEEE